jgi:hypothetical protein
LEAAMSKYDPLERHLKASGQQDVPMTFSQIEAILGFSLPPSAATHRAWWSNNPSNNVMTRSWLRAGYETASVDLAAKRLSFRKREGGRGDMMSAVVAPHTEGRETGFSEPPAVRLQHAKAGTHPAFGCMAGTIRLAPDLDPSAPADPTWAERDGSEE